MSLKDQMAADVANVFLNTDEFADSITMFDPATDPPTETPLDAVVILGFAPLVNSTEVMQVNEIGTIEMSASIVVSPHCWFVINDEIWKYTGVAGRDSAMQSITIQNPKKLVQRKARTRGL